MSTSGTAPTAFEIDMRDLLRTKKATSSDVKQTSNDYSTLVSQISGQSIYEIDHLIAGLQGVREKLNRDGDRLHNEIAQHTAFSQSIIQLTDIVSDSLASVNKAATAPVSKDAA
jgi:hypothetical protein